MVRELGYTGNTLDSYILGDNFVLMKDYIVRRVQQQTAKDPQFWHKVERERLRKKYPEVVKYFDNGGALNKKDFALAIGNQEMANQSSSTLVTAQEEINKMGREGFRYAGWSENERRFLEEFLPIWIKTEYTAGYAPLPKEQAAMDAQRRELETAGLFTPDPETPPISRKMTEVESQFLTRFLGTKQEPFKKILASFVKLKMDVDHADHLLLQTDFSTWLIHLTDADFQIVLGIIKEIRFQNIQRGWTMSATRRVTAERLLWEYLEMRTLMNIQANQPNYIASIERARLREKFPKIFEYFANGGKFDRGAFMGAVAKDGAEAFLTEFNRDRHVESPKRIGEELTELVNTGFVYPGWSEQERALLEAILPEWKKTITP
jgi:hypothetical protein